MFYLLSAIKVQRLTIIGISGLYTAPKNAQNNDVYEPASTKKTCCTSVLVSDGVHGYVQVVDLVLVDAGMKINGA